TTMHAVRAVWAEAVTTQAAIVVQRPSSADFVTLARDGEQLVVVAKWIEAQGALSLPHADEPLERTDAHEHEHEHEHEHHGSTHGEGRPATRGDHLAEMAGGFGAHARALQAAADGRDGVLTARAIGELTADCAGCHEELRGP